jgi:selenocysteine-specific elongation factor
VLTDHPRVRSTDRLLVARSGSTAAQSIRHGRRLRLHVGTDQVETRTRGLPALDEVLLLDLERPTATFVGDPAVLRDPSVPDIALGVRVLDTEPPRGVARKRMTATRLAALVAAVASRDVEAMEAARTDLHGAAVSRLAGGAPPRSMRFADDVAIDLGESALELVAEHHRGSPLTQGLPLTRARAAVLRRLRGLAAVRREDAGLAAAAITRLLDRLVADGRLTRQGDLLRDVAAAGGPASELAAAMDRLEAALSVPAPPPLGEAATAAECPPEGVRALAADGRIVRLGPDLAWSTVAFHRLAAAALDAAREQPLTPAAFRDATGTSRKYVLAILEDLDRRRILRRTPDGHVPGPRAPRAEAIAAESPR